MSASNRGRKALAADSLDDILWQSPSDRIVLSPRAGGRILSWMHSGRELVMAPVILEGGVLRVLFAEEQYPGSSYVVPHRVLSHESNGDGFRTHLRHYWNAANWFMRAAGWPEKANELHLDGLVLDKVVAYERARACLTCDVSITNVTDEMKYLTPWVHLSYAPWPADRRVVIGGEQGKYADTDIYWGSHLAKQGRPMRTVHADADGKLFAVVGAATDHLKGMCAYLPVPGAFHQATCELRYLTIDLPPRQCWRANVFLALTDNWKQWATDSPVELHSVVVAPDSPQGEECSLALLDQWMLPDERDRGLMVLSFLDKPLFSSASRYAASHSFAGFHDEDGKARAWVMLYAARDLTGVTADLAGGGEWSLRLGEGDAARQVLTNLRRHDFVRLALEGPSDLRGKDAVAVTLSVPNGQRTILRVAENASVEARYPYQVREAPAYLQRRYDEKLGPPPDAAAEELLAWQRRVRRRLKQWLEFNAWGRCEPEPRLVERQQGPACVREKWLVQTEPGLWVPGYLIYPRGLSGRRPLLYFLHGSGPGKDGFAPDEEINPPQTQLGHELEYMPYRLAVQLGCVVYVPDGRGQGELGETNPAQWPVRMEAMSISNVGLRLWDQIRALDWLVDRTDVDRLKIGSLGCSGGGVMTYMFAAADERVAASIVSSTSAASPLRPLPDGYFHRMFVSRTVEIDPSGNQPIAGAPMGMLIAPRPMWIVDGLDDLGIPADRRAEWRRTMQQGRDQIRRAYNLLHAGDRYRDDWLAGGHCAGMTFENVAAWFRQWLGL